MRKLAIAAAGVAVICSAIAGAPSWATVAAALCAGLMINQRNN